MRQSSLVDFVRVPFDVSVLCVLVPEVHGAVEWSAWSRLGVG